MFKKPDKKFTIILLVCLASNPSSEDEMSGNDDEISRAKTRLLEEQAKLEETRSALTDFLSKKYISSDSSLAECEKEAKEAALHAKAEAAKKAEAAEAEAAKKAEAAEALCDADKLELKTKADRDAEVADEKRVEEILKLQNQLIEELSKETAFLDSIMSGGK
jgi:tRNA(Ile)-lysidine synthase TilS/MesJ